MITCTFFKGLNSTVSVNEKEIGLKSCSHTYANLMAFHGKYTRIDLQHIRLVVAVANFKTFLWWFTVNKLLALYFRQHSANIIRISAITRRLLGECVNSRKCERQLNNFVLNCISYKLFHLIFIEKLNENYLVELKHSCAFLSTSVHITSCFVQVEVLLIKPFHLFQESQ